MLIFRNIQHNHRKKSWNQTNIIYLANIDHEVIVKNIEMADRAKQNRPRRNIYVCNCKIHQLEFLRGSEKHFHWGSKRRIYCTLIFVFQMYSPVLTVQCSEAMKKRKELREEDQGIQAYVKYPAVLIVWLL